MLMTDEEMKSRLAAGEHPARVSLDKWLLVQADPGPWPLERIDNFCYSRTCALCYADKEKYGNNKCNFCAELSFSCNKNEEWYLATQELFREGVAGPCVQRLVDALRQLADRVDPQP